MLAVYVIRYLGPSRLDTADLRALLDMAEYYGALVTGVDVDRSDPECPHHALRLCTGEHCCQPLQFPTEADAVAFTRLPNGTRPDGRTRYAFWGLSFAVEPMLIETPAGAAK